MQELPDGARSILDGVNFAHIATVQEDGSPQVTPVWIDRDGDVVVFNTAKGRAKHRNLLRDPRIAISVHDQDNPYVYVQVQGTVEIVDDPDMVDINRISNKYIGTDYPFAQPDEQRVTVRLAPQAVDYHPPRD
ncbi:PPOX class F420-dependent oxidoreductase [soil metagenome]